jgi:hypothetical protein
MANHSLPTLSSTYTNVLLELGGRLTDISLGYNTATTAATNIPTNTIRWNDTNKYWEIYSGTTWSALAALYNININGTVGATTASTGAFTTLTTTGVAGLAANSTVGGSLIVTAGAATTFTAAISFTNATSPIVAAKLGPTTAQQHTLPAVTSDTLALLTATQTFSNKTYSSGALTGTFTGNVTLSGQVSFTEATAPIIVAKIGPSTSQQHTLPAATSDTITLLTATQTLTNKTLGSGCTYGGTAVPVANGGTNSTTASAARTALGLAIGTDIPSLTGTGASGTWGIAITGNAATSSSCSGNSATTSKVVATDGTVGVPTISFSSDTDTGFYWGGTQGSIFITSNGVKAGEVQLGGNLIMVGNITAYSDNRLKKDLVKITSALDKVEQLVGYTYTRIDNNERNTGLIAQDVQKVLPEAVNATGEYLSLAYGNLMGLLVEAIKELRAEVKSLK